VEHPPYIAGQDSDYDGSPDPLEAIYALNIGDFVAENFISEGLLEKISARVQDEPERIRNQIEELIQIYSIDNTLGLLGFSANEGFVIYDSIAATLASMFQVDACHIFQTARQETGDSVLTLTGTSQELPGVNRWDIRIQPEPGDLLGVVFLTGQTATYPKIQGRLGWRPDERLGQKAVVSLLAAPLKDSHKRLGVLVLERYDDSPFEPELIELAEATGKVFVTAVRLQQLIAEAQNFLRQEEARTQDLLNLRAQLTESIADLGIHQQGFVETLAAAIDARYHFTRGHSRRVGEIARAIAEELSLNEKSVDLIYYAGLLGNIGKLHIPREIVEKQEHLTASELETLQNHPNMGVSLLMKMNFLTEVTPYVTYKMERWDGSGGPEGLKGRNIPLGSRILALADAYDAMTHERPYRQLPLEHAVALSELQREAGVKWDPLVVDALAKIPAASLP
jgi:HD-GYP domain-containing protein (c-di-GMP phosphodiesterase class II)